MVVRRLFNVQFARFSFDSRGADRLAIALCVTNAVAFHDFAIALCATNAVAFHDFAIALCVTNAVAFHDFVVALCVTNAVAFLVFAIAFCVTIAVAFLVLTITFCITIAVAFFGRRSVKAIGGWSVKVLGRRRNVKGPALRWRVVADSVKAEATTGMADP